MKKARIEITERFQSAWWSLYDKTGRRILLSKTYSSKGSAENGIMCVKRLMAEAEIKP